MGSRVLPRVMGMVASQALRDSHYCHHSAFDVELPHYSIVGGGQNM